MTRGPTAAISLGLTVYITHSMSGFCWIISPTLRRRVYKSDRSLRAGGQTFLLTLKIHPDEYGDYRREERRKLLDCGREERLRALETVDDQERDPDPWGGNNKEPDEAQRELIRRTASGLENRKGKRETTSGRGSEKGQPSRP
ncbi:hypothetical protein L210DRAFT_3651904 [Boletus edulis BED1]|uniref:Uncharacterized protein n=1 Tax=Boletus edulis BED1 TaxID=1328754 RepID=A0AAD4BHP0_BOLED|nr:hypothetical protein L210DRAFT_3651904 [Boletus edulis BED1]